jgi:hypothetical protein
MNLPGKRLLLGTAVAAAALGVGGFAYAAGNDPAPDQGYVTVENDAATPSADPSTGPSTGTQRDGRDCPDKTGTEQPQTQPEQTPADPQGNA